ncbi:MAG TPA: helix-turn-helix domain-containing protein [Methanotrichaceae archaeon]|nr:helix-turn-helix domain-containing protein [Methanotrichaceae archaeon]
MELTLDLCRWVYNQTLSYRKRRLGDGRQINLEIRDP